ncbi:MULTISPECIES: hypothetical protein [Paenibacillus]|uniref:Uncharacterized protein n=2 Tax=Paenibacillus TaxID=44249 RepID=A0ABX2ZC11_PAEPO|nr:MULTISPECIES: hypothetical protein [Paenibacillus]MDR6779377.1 hypothetical protein [Paenibacillus peoriae]ODA07685.1 hypothetical protein A7312_28180 [Paenibacillus polymyxa]
MFTILLEVKRNDDQRKTNEFYTPATPEFKRFPRTKKGINRAMEELLKLVNNKSWVADYRFVFYRGKYHHSKSNMKPLFVIGANGEHFSI